MIKTKEDYKYYLEADRIALSRKKTKGIIAFVKSFIYKDYIYYFEKQLRKTEYFVNRKKTFFNKITLKFQIVKFKRISVKLNFTIPLNVFDAGLSIAHYGTIIINEGTKIGKNCRIHACVNIGTKAGLHDSAPNIGDNCYIAPGAKIYGKINIGNNIVIGANAVVNKSFAEDNITIAGVPAKKISNKGSELVIIDGTTFLNK